MYETNEDRRLRLKDMQDNAWTKAKELALTSELSAEDLYTQIMDETYEDGYYED